ncbi:hypothetical protein KY284_028095 [Solanum tuberosum]|nr:hypothetical protein KY284_028095 [Solanum tuberosum]
MANDNGEESSDTGRNPNGIGIENANSSLYMHPSDNPGVALVPIPFDGTGYRSWKRGVYRALSVKNKLGFVNGECKRPDLETPQYRQLESVEYVNDSFELWRELENQYDQTNGAKLYQIQREINDLSQGTLDITTYYTRMKRLWEELSTLHVKTQCKYNCSCRAKESVFRAEQERRLIQFLMGLNETYTTVQGNIRMMNPLPSLAQTFSLLVQDEKQREIKLNTQLFIESTALNAGNSGKMMMESGSFNASSLGGASTSRQPRQNAAGNNNFRTNYSQTTTYNGNRGRLVCDYCRKIGHTRDR